MERNRDRLNEGGGKLPIAEGTTVYDVNGDKIGTVERYTPQANCLMVQKGIVFPKDIYIPASAIDRSDADGVYVGLSKDELKDDRYSAPPATDTTASRSRADRADMNDQSAGMRGHQTPPRDGDVAVPVREEELVAEKRRGEAGRVGIHKDVVEQQQVMDVPVQHEDVSVERIPVDKDVPADRANAGAWQDKDVVMPVMGEEVVAEKRPRVKEEIHVHKKPVTETERVADTVRKEKVNVDGVDDQGNPVDRNMDRNP